MALTLQDIEQLFRDHGHIEYSGEGVTQLEHALQCAQRAEQDQAPPDRLVASVKARLRDVPHHGTTYGLLRFLTRDAAIARTMAQLPSPDVLFLYLGRLDANAAAPGRFSRAGEDVGRERHPDHERAHSLELTALVRDGRLQVYWTYSRNRHRRETIESLVASFRDALAVIVAEGAAPASRSYTASDFPQSGLDQAALDRLLSKLGRT